MGDTVFLLDVGSVMPWAIPDVCTVFSHLLHGGKVGSISAIAAGRAMAGAETNAKATLTSLRSTAASRRFALVSLFNALDSTLRTRRAKKNEIAIPTLHPTTNDNVAPVASHPAVAAKTETIAPFHQYRAARRL